MTLLSIPSRRRFLRLSAVALAAAAASCTVRPQKLSTPSDAQDETAAALPLVNALRAKNGLPPLAIDPAAVQAAIFQASRMADAGRMAHVMGIADGFGPRVKASGVRLPAAENIATGQQTIPAVVTAWINSPHHLENMLGRYSGLGVAVARNPSSRNIPYWSMVLSN